MDNDSQILNKELGKIGAISGAETAKSRPFFLMRFAPVSWDTFAGEKGAELGAMLLKEKDYSARFQFTDNSEAINSRCLEVIKKIGGNLIKEPNLSPGTISAVVHSGISNLNPAILRIFVSQNSGGGTEILLRAVAKEGLINQHTAQKAVENFAAMIQPGVNLEKIESTNPQSNILPVLCLTSGIFSLTGFFVPYLGIAGGIPGIITGVRARKSVNSKAITWGIILSSIGLLLTVIRVIMIFAYGK